MGCDSCRKASEDILVLKTKFWNVIIASNQAYLGRCYVTLNRHAGSLSDLTKEEWTEFTEIVKKLEFTFKKSFDATMFNWTCMMNNSYKTNPPNPHVHWHLIPRYNHNVEFFGEIFKDTEFAHHYNKLRKKEVSKVILKNIVNKLKENLY